MLARFALIFVFLLALKTTLELTEILYLACLLARFLFFAWLYFLSVSARFATALLRLGTRLGSPPRHFYGEAHRAPP